LFYNNSLIIHLLATIITLTGVATATANVAVFSDIATWRRRGSTIGTTACTRARESRHRQYANRRRRDTGLANQFP